MTSHETHVHALQQADSAARRSDVVISTVRSLDALRGVLDLLDRVWDNTGPPLISLEHLRALACAGNYVAAAYDGEDMIGASVGFFAAPPGRVLHSDVTGVVESAAGRQLGFALKLHQRAWALGQGLSEITWTFDPLVARNAHFNLTKLRARAVAYHVDFYGDMADGVNQGQGSDRLLVSWPLTEPQVIAACSLTMSAMPRGRDEQARIAIPADIAALRKADAEAARRWRTALRETLGVELGADRMEIVGFERDAGYVVRRRGGEKEPP